MKQLVSSKFLRTLRKASQTGVEIDAKVLENCYDEFVLLVFPKDTGIADKSAFLNMLVYTRVELASLKQVSGKKRLNHASKRLCAC
jgi:hypothetical protein